MTAAEKEKRQAKSTTLQVSPMEEDIHRDELGDLIAGRWLVTCEPDPNLRHQVRFEGAAASRWSCSCPDYRYHRGGEPSWACKHILAVQGQTQPKAPVAPKAQPYVPDPRPERERMVGAIAGAFGVQVQKAPGKPPAIGFVAPVKAAPTWPPLTTVLSSRERIELECQAMFGDRDAIAALNGKSVRQSTYEPAPMVEVPRTPQPAAVKAAETVPPLTAAALLTPDDSGWIDCCPACGRSLPECVCPQEPPQDPCMKCGQLLPAAEMLPLRAIVQGPQHQSAEGSGLVCQECYGEIEATAEKMTAIDPYSWTPEQLAECRNETEQLRAEAAEIRATNETFRQQWETRQSTAATAVPTLASRIDQVNNILSSFGAIAIEADHHGFVGYGAQYVLDSVNAALGYDGWKYDLINHQLEKVGEKGTRALVMIQLSLKQDDGSWFSHGPQFGGGQNGDPADALKSALTDALKKALSHWGIGNLAYRGELKAPKSSKTA